MNAPMLFDEVPAPAAWSAPSSEEAPTEFPRRCYGGSSLLPEGGRELDNERALRLMAALSPGTADAKIFVIPGEPASKSRPRFGRGGQTYKTDADTDAEKRTGWHFRRLFQGEGPWTGNVALGCVFFRPNRQRIDVDNMLKHICDSANGIAWVDDSQVTAACGIAEYDADNPRTIVVVARHHSTLTRGTDNDSVCAHCRKPFKTDRPTTQRHCSKVCANKAAGRDLSELVDCKGCGKPFRRKTATQVFCSFVCSRAYWKGRPRNRRNNRSKCSQCDAQLSHNRGGRCRACWKADPTPGKGVDR